MSALGKKFGIFDATGEDEDLINQWLKIMEDEDLDFTLSFRSLSRPKNDFRGQGPFKDFLVRWEKRLKDQSQSREESMELMNRVNPVFIPRNHQVERAIQAAVKADYSVFKEMNEMLKNPFEEQDRFAAYQTAPKPDERITETFCGT